MCIRDSNKIDRFAHAVELARLPPIMQEFFTMEVDENQWRQLWRFDIYRVNKGMWRELIISHSRQQDQAQGRKPATGIESLPETGGF